MLLVKLIKSRTNTSFSHLLRLPPPGVFREATTDFTVDARALTQSGGNHIKTLISNPSGSCTDALITDLGDGTYNVEYTPYEEGEWQRVHSVKAQALAPLFRSQASRVVVFLNLYSSDVEWLEVPLTDG